MLQKERWQTEEKGIDHKENQEIYLLLLKFRKWQEELTKYKGKVREVIHAHLLSLNKKPPTRTECIEEICKTAIEILSPQKVAPFAASCQKAVIAMEDTGMVVEESPVWDVAMEFEGEEHIPTPHQFQKKWLTNVPVLLSGASEALQCLPYLLTCYTQNIIRHRIDPFDEKVKISGWDDIFKKLPSGEGNRNHSISVLENCFIDFPKKVDIMGLFQTGDEHIYDSELSDSLSNNFRALSQKPNWKKAIEEAGDCVKSWELYRRFASFCEACSDVKEVNITLSTALFSCGMTPARIIIEDICDIQAVDSYESVSRDSLRNEILSLTRKYDNNGFLKTIHERTYHARLDYLAYYNKKPI